MGTKPGSVVRGAIRAYKAKRDGKNNYPVEGQPQNLKHGDLGVTDALPSLGSFKEGMGTLVECLAGKLGEDLRFGVNVKSVAPQNGGEHGKSGWRIRLSSADEINADAVVVATPSYAAGTLL